MLLLFTNNMIMYAENTEENKLELLKFRNNLRKVVGNKANIKWKPTAFLFIRSKWK